LGVASQSLTTVMGVFALVERRRSSSAVSGKERGTKLVQAAR